MKIRALQALIGSVVSAVAIGFIDWRIGLGIFGLMLWVDSWRAAR